MKFDRKRRSPLLGASSIGHGPLTTYVRINNQSQDVLKLQLRLVGRDDVFEIPKDFQRIELIPGAHVSIPVRLVKRNTFRIMAINVCHRAFIHWQGESDSDVLKSAPVIAYGPLYAPSGMRPCLHSPGAVSGELREPHHSPPDIHRSVYRTGTRLVANMGVVDHSYSINIERVGDWLEIDNNMWPESVAWTDSYGYTHALEHCELSETREILTTRYHRLTAGNDDGLSIDEEWFYAKHLVGHRSACIPEAPDIPAAETTVIRNFLDDVEDWIRGGGLEDFNDYVDYWNTNIRTDPGAAGCNDRSFDDEGCWFNAGDPIPDMRNITERVGDGGLADDMLAALEDIIIYTTPAHLPRTFRPDAHFDTSHSRLCDRSVGITYSAEPRSAGSYGEWIAICREGDANDMTIIHELFHYASGEYYESEDRAFMISYLYIASRYGWKPSEDWPDWV